jgi:hypothetical protein
MLKKLFAKADLSKEDVANIVYEQVMAKRFLILTHKLGKQAYLLKKLLPSKRYINMMLSKTKAMKKAMAKQSA